MAFIIKEAYDHLEDAKLLFTEYVEMLGVDLSSQHFDDEKDRLPGEYGKPFGNVPSL